MRHLTIITVLKYILKMLVAISKFVLMRFLFEINHTHIIQLLPPFYCNKALFLKQSTSMVPTTRMIL